MMNQCLVRTLAGQGGPDPGCLTKFVFCAEMLLTCALCVHLNFGRALIRCHRVDTPTSAEQVAAEEVVGLATAVGGTNRPWPILVRSVPVTLCIQTRTNTFECVLVLLGLKEPHSCRKWLHPTNTSTCISGTVCGKTVVL